MDWFCPGANENCHYKEIWETCAWKSSKLLEYNQTLSALVLRDDSPAMLKICQDIWKC